MTKTRKPTSHSRRAARRRARREEGMSPVIMLFALGMTMIITAWIITLTS